MLLDNLYKNLPEYYPSMYLDGYTPEQILFAFKRKMVQDFLKDPKFNLELENKVEKVVFDSVGKILKEISL